MEVGKCCVCISSTPNLNLHWVYRKTEKVIQLLNKQTERIATTIQVLILKDEVARDARAKEHTNKICRDNLSQPLYIPMLAFSIIMHAPIAYGLSLLLTLILCIREKIYYDY